MRLKLLPFYDVTLLDPPRCFDAEEAHPVFLYHWGIENFFSKEKFMILGKNDCSEIICVLNCPPCLVIKDAAHLLTKVANSGCSMFFIARNSCSGILWPNDNDINVFNHYNYLAKQKKLEIADYMIISLGDFFGVFEHDEENTYGFDF